MTGSTTDPVIRKSTIRVAPTMIPTAIGRCSSRLCWKSRNSAVAPVTSNCAARRRLDLLHPAHRLAAGVRDVRVGRDRLEHDIAARKLAGGIDLDDALCPPKLRDDRLGLGDRRVLGEDADRRVAIGRELGPDRIVHLPGALLGGEDLRVRVGELDREERDPERDQERRARDGHRRRAPHHQAGEPVPEAVLHGLRLALGAALQELRGERVDALAEQSQHRRQHDQRDRCRE